MTSRKKLSIITATYNSEKTINNLILSFRRSKNEFVEWIIIDNKSTDRTIQIINKNLDLIDKFITEPDTGIYDAWNKGVKLSSGDYVAFIGSDDDFSDKFFNSAIEAINKFPDNNIIAFKILYKTPKDIKILNHKNYVKPYNYPINLGFYHPGTLHSRNLFLDKKFDTSFKIAGDREFLTRCFKNLTPIIYNTDDIQIIHYHGGISTNNKHKLYQHKEVLKIILKIPDKTKIIFYYLAISYFKYLHYRIKTHFANE